jgi:hypothetical protein
MATIIFEIRRDKDCFFYITKYPDGRKSSRINCTWCGLIDQFKNKLTSEKHIKKQAIEWLKKKLNEKQDPQFSSKKDFEWLLKNLTNETNEQNGADS